MRTEAATQSLRKEKLQQHLVSRRANTPDLLVCQAQNNLPDQLCCAIEEDWTSSCITEK